MAVSSWYLFNVVAAALAKRPQQAQFVPGTSYPIDTLPDDLFDDAISPSQKWAIRDALFWNDCQGWWIAHICDERTRFDWGKSIARYWQPLPVDPMTRVEILAERDMVICPACDIAITPGGDHNCRPRP